MPFLDGVLAAATTAVFLFAAVGARALNAPAIARHDLSVTLRVDESLLSGADTLTVRTGGASHVDLALAAGARVTDVSTGGKALPFSFANGKLSVRLPEDVESDETAITVSYEIGFRDPAPADPVNADEPSYGVKGTISPRGVFLAQEAGWYPDIPGGGPTWRVRVAGPEGIEAVTAGRLVRRQVSAGHSVSEWEVAHPLEGLALSAGRYIVREGSSGGTALYTYFYPEDDPLSGKYLAAAARFLDLYRGMFGEYPFEKFAVVENFFPTGYGFPSYTLLGNTVVRLPFIAETSLGHEIAHSWWGNGVLADDAGGNWSEGLVTYVADHLYRERTSPAEGRDYRLQILRDYAALVPPSLDVPLAQFAGRVDPATRAMGYGKAAMVFHMARRKAGDEAFWQGLRAVAREKLFRTASWDDFGRAFFRDRPAEAASFIRQWVGRPGAPALALKEIRSEREGGRWKVTGTLVQQRPHFDLRVPLRLETEGGPVDATVPIHGKDTRFELSSDARPERLVVDPEVDVFRRLDPSEIPPLVNSVRGSENLLVVAARGLRPELLQASRILLAALGKGDASVAREEDLPPSALPGHDLLYLGLPRGNGFLPPLPRELSATNEDFSLDGTKYASPGDALFAVFPHPSDKRRVAAVFLPLSAEAASKAGRKIPHYGKYSFLAFSDGTNRAKGTWPATGSPVIHTFPPAPQSRSSGCAAPAHFAFFGTQNYLYMNSCTIYGWQWDNRKVFW